MRLTTNTAWPRQTTFNIWPASSFEASTATGAPSAFARALGCQEARNGTAAKATPIAPVPTVAAVNSRRRLWSTWSLMQSSHALLTNLHANPYGGRVSQRILRAHYTQISARPLRLRERYLAEHSRLREFLDQSGRHRSGRGVSRGLVESDAARRAHCRRTVGRRDAEWC